MTLVGRLATGSLVALAAIGSVATPVPARESGDRAPVVRSSRWLNSEPLTDAALRGKVRLVEFWTFACINCLRTVPAMNRLQQRLAGGDVVVIGVHTPELDRERDPRQVEEAIRRLQIRFPVALDNDYATWRAYGNHYWPALYVVDKRGVIRHVHVGELHEGTTAWKSLLDLVERLRREPA